MVQTSKVEEFVPKEQTFQKMFIVVFLYRAEPFSEES